MKRKKIFQLFAFVCLAVLPATAQNWMPIGPVNRQYYGTGSIDGQGAGRLNAIEFDPAYLTNHKVYAGAWGGGFWYTTYDTTFMTCAWSNSGGLNSDNLPANANQVQGCGVSAIAVDPLSPNIIYIAGRTMELGALGVYKNVNQTAWVATGLSYNSPNSKSIYSLVAHDDGTSTTILLAGTSDGVSRSADGGTTWTNVLTDGPDKPFEKIMFRPGSNTEVYAVGRDVYKSTDAGVTWTLFSNFASMYPAGTVQEGTMAVASNGVLYASMLVTDPTNAYNMPGQPTNFYISIVFLRYDPTTSTWSTRPMFGFYFDVQISRMKLAIDPANPNVVYASQEQVHKYDDTKPGYWVYASPYMSDNIHADVQSLGFAPDSSLWVGTDGGISVAQTFDIYGNPIWKRQNTNFNTALIAGFGGSQQDPDLVLVGEDDNGNSISTNADPTNFTSITWTGYGIGDGKEKYIDYSDSTNWYSDPSAYLPTRYTRDTSGSPLPTTAWHDVFDETDPWGFRDFGINQPILQDPYRPNIMYKADNFLARSFDYGETSDFIFAEGGCAGSPPTAWYTVVTAMADCRLNPEVMYIATYNNQPSYMYTPRILKTTVATTMPGASAGPGAYCPYWTDIAPPLPPGLIGGPPLGFHYSGIAVSDYDPNKIWVSYQYDGASTGIPAIKVMTYDGTTWTDYSTGLPPAISVTNMVYESGSNDGLYIGTSCGVYYRNASMNSWTPYMTNHPSVLVRDMEINYGNNTVRTGTLGRGIWSSPLSCPSTPSIIFSGTPLSVNGVIEVSSFISFQNVTMTSGHSIFRAGDYIDLLPDFLITANTTTDFYAFIHGCNGPGNSFRTASPSPEEGDQPKMEKHDDELSVFPNPTNGIFTVGYPLWNETNKQASVVVYDFEGKQILQKTVHAGERIDVDLSDKPVGIYFVRFISPDGVKSTKIIHE